MKKINFITNQDLNITSGGWSGINFNIHKELVKYFDINYVGPIAPRMMFSQKLVSKVLRMINLKGDFSFFSNRRLEQISKKVSEKILPAEYDFFFGQTAWIGYKSSNPYGVYLDADFKTYLEIFSTPQEFRKRDIERIAKKEELWLQGAKHIFVGSQWAWNEMLKYYDLKEEQKRVVYTGGNVEMPVSDNYKGSLNLIFISLNFEKKGGFICVDAFKEVKLKHPDVTLTVIGERPPSNILEIEGIEYAGLLRKTIQDEYKIFKKLISEAFLLIHPTKMDTMGAVLIEAGYFGCPSIAPKSFGVPELVLHNKTGLIVDVPFSSQDFSDHINFLIENKSDYLNMREAARNYTTSKLTWESIGTLISNQINT